MCNVDGRCFVFIYVVRFPRGVQRLSLVSPIDVEKESGIKDDSGMQDVQYTEVTRSSHIPLCFVS